MGKWLLNAVGAALVYEFISTVFHVAALTWVERQKMKAIAQAAQQPEQTEPLADQENVRITGFSYFNPDVLYDPVDETHHRLHSFNSMLGTAQSQCGKHFKESLYVMHGDMSLINCLDCMEEMQIAKMNNADG